MEPFPIFLSIRLPSSSVPFTADSYLLDLPPGLLLFLSDRSPLGAVVIGPYRPTAPPSPLYLLPRLPPVAGEISTVPSRFMLLLVGHHVLPGELYLIRIRSVSALLLRLIPVVIPAGCAATERYKIKTVRSISPEKLGF